MSKKSVAPKWEYRRGPIAVISSSRGDMECLECGAVWRANIRPDLGGNFYRGSWTCHNCGANSKGKYSPED